MSNLNNRDDFSKQVREILGKRVGFLCSNPECRKLTIGTHTIKDKSTTIGQAAHISAAAPGGPRFDIIMTPEQRKSIDNGIWLCSNCATLIDKNLQKFSVNELKQWKAGAENETAEKMAGDYKIKDKPKVPNLEIDLVFTSRGRWNRGYSENNPTEIYNGKEVYILYDKPVVHWNLNWFCNIDIYNNSMAPAFNVSIESVGEAHFSNLPQLRRINNIPPLGNIQLEAMYEKFKESNHLIADEMLHQNLPPGFDKLILEMKYSDESGMQHKKYFQFVNGDPVNSININE